jgi:hypothetical protein
MNALGCKDNSLWKLNSSRRRFNIFDYNNN